MPVKSDDKRKKVPDDLLKDIRQQISSQEFYRKALLIHEEEKKRISRDLHDETGQIVIALGASLNVMEKELKAGHAEKVLEIINDNRKLIQGIANRMKLMALNLRPPGLDILGLPAVLREYFSQCTKSSRVKIEFNENLKDRKLDENIEIALYRIVQEAMFNIQKHSHATVAKIDLILGGDRLTLLVDDNGKGFDVKAYDTSPDSARMGLRGISERVAILNGTFSIESTPGKGTKLKIALHLEDTPHGN